MGKLAVIAGGGGMRCAYSAGVLLALGEEFGLREPDIAIGSSGSAGSMSYYLAGQYEYLWKAWSGVLSDTRFLNLFRLRKMIDVDYLIDNLFKEQYPLDKEKIMNSKTDFFICATNAESGELEYFNCKDELLDLYEIMRASKAMPIFYGKKVELNGGKYIDTYDNGLIHDSVRKAKEAGANKAVVIRNGCADLISDYVFNLWLNFQSEIFQDRFYRYMEERNARREGINVFYVDPMQELKVSTLSSGREIMEKTLIQGYSETKGNCGLERFLDER